MTFFRKNNGMVVVSTFILLVFSLKTSIKSDNLMNTNTKQICINASRDLFPYPLFITLTEDQYETLKNIQSKYIIISNLIPREMTIDEKYCYDTNHPAMETKDRITILNQLRCSCSCDQMIKIKKFYRLYPDFLFSLIDCNFSNAKAQLDEALVATNSISQDEYNFIMDKLIHE